MGCSALGRMSGNVPLLLTLSPPKTRWARPQFAPLLLKMSWARPPWNKHFQVERLNYPDSFCSLASKGRAVKKIKNLPKVCILVKKVVVRKWLFHVNRIRKWHPPQCTRNVSVPEQLCSEKKKTPLFAQFLWNKEFKFSCVCVCVAATTHSSTVSLNHRIQMMTV